MKAISPVIPLMKILMMYASMSWREGCFLSWLAQGTEIHQEKGRVKNFLLFREPICSEHPAISILNWVSIFSSYPIWMSLRAFILLGVFKAENWPLESAPAVAQDTR